MTPLAPAGPVGALAHLRLFLWLKLATEANRYRTLSGALPAALGALVVAGASLALGVGAYLLLTHPAVEGSPLWSRFLLRLVCFLTSVVFVTWPVLSAGVDEHSELSRFATFPLKPSRLFAVSSIVALIEPRTAVFYAPIAGALAGYARVHPVPLTAALLLVAAYFALNVAWGRAALTLVLNVLRHRRSAEMLGAGFVGALFLASLVPPIDTRWLAELFAGAGQAALGAVDERIVIAASIAIARLPPGALAWGVELAAEGNSGAAIEAFLVLAFWAAVGFAIAYALLLRFYRGTARPMPPPRDASLRGGGRSLGAFGALVHREASDWLRNPKARLLCAVPFFLCILLKLVSAHGLTQAIGGGAADAWLLTTLCAYAGLVVAANFAQNTFGYDGPGLAQLFAAPVRLRSVLVAKNLVHAAGAMAVGGLLTGFYAVWVHPPSALSSLVGVLALLGQIPILLSLGNGLSVMFPRKYHASLRRRDRPPPAATLGGLAAAAIAVLPAGAVMRSLHRAAPSFEALALLAAAAALGWALWWLTLPLACQALERRREAVLRAVMRE